MKLLRRYPGGKTHIGAIEGAAPTCKRCLAILARREKQ